MSGSANRTQDRFDGAEIHHIGVMPAPFGSIVVRATLDQLLAVDLSLERCVNDADDFPIELLREADYQFRAYFKHAATPFSLPLRAHGTPHQRVIWQTLRGIPPGATRSYGALAKMLNTGARVIAAACRANPYPLVIPCHRVVGACDLGGYCGHTNGPWLDVKRWLLHHEAE